MVFINSPFVFNFVESIKDEQSIYFLSEFINGVELFYALRDIGLLDSQISKFYVGQMILALEYLHANHIVHRDIRPESFIVDQSGNLTLTEFGNAKILKTSEGIS